MITVFIMCNLSWIYCFDNMENEWVICNIIKLEDVSNEKLKRYFECIQKLKRKRGNLKMEVK